MGANATEGCKYGIADPTPGDAVSAGAFVRVDVCTLVGANANELLGSEVRADGARVLVEIGEIVEAFDGAFVKAGVTELESPGVVLSVGAGVVESVGTRAGSFVAIARDARVGGAREGAAKMEEVGGEVGKYVTGETVSTLAGIGVPKSVEDGAGDPSFGVKA